MGDQGHSWWMTASQSSNVYSNRKWPSKMAKLWCALFEVFCFSSFGIWSLISLGWPQHSSSKLRDIWDWKCYWYINILILTKPGAIPGKLIWMLNLNTRELEFQVLWCENFHIFLHKYENFAIGWIECLHLCHEVGRDGQEK
jgi:hypothetical protein